jgi:hypothetical protein
MMEVAAANTAVATPVQDLDGGNEAVVATTFATSVAVGVVSHDCDDVGRIVFASSQTRNNDTDIPCATAELVVDRVVINDEEEQDSREASNHQSEYTTISVCKPSTRSPLGSHSLTLFLTMELLLLLWSTYLRVSVSNYPLEAWRRLALDKPI